MNILYEDTMPYATHFFPDLGQCKAFSSQTIKPADLRETDILLVRSTTKVDEPLLQFASNLKYVATATAGSNHLDKAHLKQRELPWGSAAGCNAIAVAEYVLSCLMVKFSSNFNKLQNLTVGIVGAGHVGSALQQRLTALGIANKLCDPPLQQAGDPRQFVSLDEICQCDVISLHVPLIETGEHPTRHLFDDRRLAQLAPEQLLINACRGEVVDNQALKRRLSQGQPLQVFLDVWENEPAIDFGLLPYLSVATEHIAGHTLEGKARGTYMLYQQVCERFNIDQKLTFESCLPAKQSISLTLSQDSSDWQQVHAAILATYNVAHDSRRFKQQVSSAEQFVYSRKHYAIRREFASVELNTGNLPVSKALYALGFNTNRT